MDMKSRRHGCELVPESANALETFGFVLLRQFFDPGPLAAEIDKVMANGILRDVPKRGDIRFQYVPMMTAQTPVSLSLLDRAETVAAAVFGGPVLPTRAKGTRYHGETPWHTDSDLPLRSVGFLAYLEPVGAGSGALRVIPGSHHPKFSEAVRGRSTVTQAMALTVDSPVAGRGATRGARCVPARHHSGSVHALAAAALIGSLWGA